MSKEVERGSNNAISLFEDINELVDFDFSSSEEEDLVDFDFGEFSEDFEVSAEEFNFDVPEVEDFEINAEEFDFNISDFDDFEVSAEEFDFDMSDFDTDTDVDSSRTEETEIESTSDEKRIDETELCSDFSGERTEETLVESRISKVRKFLAERKAQVFKIGGVVCYAIIILAIVLFRTIDSDEVSYKRGSPDLWIESFTSGDFETCDSMVVSQRDKILTYDTDLAGTYSKSVDMYKALLKKGASLIDEVLVSGEETYTLKLKQVKSATEVVVDEKALNTLVTRYKGNELKQRKFKQELEDLYFDAFKQTVLTGCSGETIQVEVHLYDDNGKVRNTYAIIEHVLKDTNLLDNMKLYEDSVQAEFNYYLQIGR